MERRNFFITLGIAVCILFVGGFIFRDSAAGSQLSVVAAFAIGLTLLNVLDARERSRKRGKG
jgi:hypothetical protein